MNVKQVKKGELMEINKNLLEIDTKYQRQPSKKLIKSIESDWNWGAANVIVVNKRENKHYVIDGQHRVRAAQNIPSITHLPCIVFDNLDFKSEAHTAFVMNTKRKNPTAVDKFNYLLNSGNEIALYVKNRVESYNYQIANKGNRAIRGVNHYVKCAKTNKERFERVLLACSKLCKYETIPTKLFRGLARVDKSYQLDARLMERLVDIGYHKVIDGIDKACIAFGNRHELTFARGIMETANKNLRNKFEFAD